MPLLTRDYVISMLAQDCETCADCGREVHRNYCRECDDFLSDGHLSNCPRAMHVGHRGYDLNAPMVGDNGAGYFYEHQHGVYRLNKSPA